MNTIDGLLVIRFLVDSQRIFVIRLRLKRITDSPAPFLIICSKFEFSCFTTYKYTHVAMHIGTTGDWNYNAFTMLFGSHLTGEQI